MNTSNRTCQKITLIISCILGLLLFGFLPFAAHADALVDGEPIISLAKKISAGPANATGKVLLTARLIQKLEQYPEMNSSVREEIRLAALKLIKSKDDSLIHKGAVILDLWSEATHIHLNVEPTFENKPTLWANIFDVSIENQNLPKSSGGYRFKRILYRHSWSRGEIAELPLRNRMSWTKTMVEMIHKEEPVIEPFFLNTVWSMPPKNRLEFVKLLATQMNPESARLLVALTIYTLVPQKIVDDSKNYMSEHRQKKRKHIYRNINSELRIFNSSDTDDLRLLKDAIRINLRTANYRSQMAALIQAKSLVEERKTDPGLIIPINLVINNIFDNEAYLLYPHAYFILAPMYEHDDIVFEDIQNKLDIALSHNPFDTNVTQRIPLIQNSRAAWIIFLGTIISKKDVDAVKSREMINVLKSIEVNEWTEELLSGVLHNASEVGVITKNEYKKWRKANKVTTKEIDAK